MIKQSPIFKVKVTIATFSSSVTEKKKRLPRWLHSFFGQISVTLLGDGDDILCVFMVEAFYTFLKKEKLTFFRKHLDSSTIECVD